MVTKAFHIEAMSNLSTNGFLGGLRRFIARRRNNGTNFQGARSELNELHTLLQSDELKDEIFYLTSDNNIQFHFIPPSSPHFEGLWEGGVKSYNHFKCVASNMTWTLFGR